MSNTQKRKNTHIEYNKGKHVHSAFDSGSSYALAHGRAYKLKQKQRANMIKSNNQLQNDVDQLNKKGYLVLRNLITDNNKLDNVYNESQKLLQKVPFGRNKFEGRRTKRVHNLTSKSRVYDEFVLHKRCLDILDYYLYSNHLLSILQIIEINKNSAAQPLHYDSQSLYGIQRPRIDIPMQLAFIWALDDNYSPQNGATVLYPGSHLWPMNRSPTLNDKKISLNLNRGDAICFMGTLWHSGGQHIGNTDKSRLILTSQHVQPYIRQIENLMLATPLDIVKTLPNRLQIMMGYSVHFPFYGAVDGIHPKKAIQPLLDRYSKL